jgi:hypothetical protein
MAATARPQLRFESAPEQENSPASAKGALSTVARKSGAKVLGEVNLNTLSIAETDPLPPPAPLREPFGTLPDKFVLAPGPLDPAQPEASGPWLLTREGAHLEPLSPSCPEAVTERKIILCSFDRDEALEPSKFSVQRTHKSTMEVGTSPDDFLRQKLEEWTNDIECLLPFYDQAEANGHGNGVNGQRNGENPITRIRDCCSALADTNTLLQRMAKVAELNSAKSDLDEIETTIETLYTLMQVLGRITQSEVTKMRKLADPAKAKPPTRPLSAAAQARPLSSNQARSASPAKFSATPKTNVKKPVAPAPARATSVRLPAVPHIDLPGEAISRQKRLAIENKRRAEEEELRKKREFKARPAPSTIGSSSGSFPRQTLASRARAAMSENASADQRPVMAGTKRLSMAAPSSTTVGRPSLNSNSTSSSSSRQGSRPTPGSGGRDSVASEG